MTPQQYVQQKAAASGSSFYYAFLFLPAPRRAAITAFYAFCREVDDVVDEVSDPGVARTKDDIIAARDAMRAKGCTILGTGEPRIGAHGTPILFLHPKDMGGVLVELMETPKEAH